MSKISLLLKYYRENCDLSQQQVAQALNIDRSTYTYYETGKTIPSINTLIRISRIFNVPYNVFFDCIDQELFSDSSVSDVSNEPVLDKTLIKKSDDLDKIYDLSKEEKDLLIYYRLLSGNEQMDLMNSITSKANEAEDKSNKK